MWPPRRILRHQGEDRLWSKAQHTEQGRSDCVPAICTDACLAVGPGCLITSNGERENETVRLPMPSQGKGTAGPGFIGGALCYVLHCRGRHYKRRAKHSILAKLVTID